MDSSTPDGAPEAPETTTEAETQQGDPAGEAPSWFRDYAERQDRDRKALNKELEKLRRRVAGKDEAPAQGDPAGPAVQHAAADDSRAEMLAAVKWGNLSSKLTEGARRELENRLSEGGSFGEVVQMAEMLTKFGPKGSKDGAAAPRDEARPGARTNASASYPQTYNEFQQLALKARSGDAEAQRRHSQLMTDPDFLESFRNLK